MNLYAAATRPRKKALNSKRVFRRRQEKYKPTHRKAQVTGRGGGHTGFHRRAKR